MRIINPKNYREFVGEYLKKLYLDTTEQCGWAEQVRFEDIEFKEDDGLMGIKKGIIDTLAKVAKGISDDSIALTCMDVNERCRDIEA